MFAKRSRVLLGLPDAEFAQRRPGSNTMTKREVRAIALANLEVHLYTVLWDIGSGTGSVAIEAAHLATLGHIYAIECDTGALAAIATNCQHFNATNVTIVAGRAPQVLRGLPDPDAVFVGGSGGDLSAILEEVMARLHPQGVLVVNLTSFEHLSEATNSLRRAHWGVDCTLVNIARTQNILDVTRFAALNPVFVLTAHRPQRPEQPVGERKEIDG
ncbi:MAG: precorrin-6Y C5,15-methyltransferase (decarboxylating) subunit CbiT [Ktedonobacteraceae bacterium]|nr:precorrin-6Y C5,15-methyltransferase (decarboxylating) subunit CbiT [Ktedonobacteraceae bacterium]